MAIGQKLLIDTNVLILLEDWKELPASFARLQNLSSRHGYRLYVHEAAKQDVARDQDRGRRKITLSKLQKFEELAGVKSLPRDVAVQRYGKIAKPNDEVDVALLYALELGAVDFLVTEDQGIHARARRRGLDLADRVLTVAEVVNWITAAHEPKAVSFPLVQEVPAHAIDLSDPIFGSLREGYAEFDDWWRQKCVAEHRPCWVVSVEDQLAGIVVRKDETESRDGAATKMLKLCTFKVANEFRGEKLGELLLKQALWFALRNHYQGVYLTTFPAQAPLISILEYFGFKKSGPDSRGELRLEKSLGAEWPTPIPNETLFDTARINYPRFVPPPDAPLFCIPIQGEFHDMLFPELEDRTQLSLFESAGIEGAYPRTPGNTIRKVYLSKTNASPPPGSVIAFYRSAKKVSDLSQSLTTIGVVERVSETRDLEALIRLTAKRSVYRVDQLERMVQGNGRAVKVIDFLLVDHLAEPLRLPRLLELGVFSRHPPQSIAQIDPRHFTSIAKLMHI